MAKIKIDREKVGSTLKHYAQEASVLVTSDDNIFLASGAGKNMCRDHCKRANASYVELTREQFDTGITEIESSETKRKSATLESSPKGSSDSEKEAEKAAKAKAAQEAFENDWTTGKWDMIVGFAKEKGLEVTTKKNQGKEALIEEVKTFLATLESGANETTDHKNAE